MELANPGRVPGVRTWEALYNCCNIMMHCSYTLTLSANLHAVTFPTLQMRTISHRAITVAGKNSPGLLVAVQGRMVVKSMNAFIREPSFQPQHCL